MKAFPTQRAVNQHISASKICLKEWQRPGENLPWQPVADVNLQPHDELAPETHRKNYFTPSRFYCIETICAPCGVVIA